MKSEPAPSVAFWVISGILLLWGLGGVSIYVAYFLETPEGFALTAETAANRDAYAQYVASIPLWAISVGIVAAVTRLLGAIALLLRSTWALPFYLVSLPFFLLALYRAFILADVAQVMSPGHIATEAVFLALGVFAIWFAYQFKANGTLK
jgi:hypothetical protein